MNRWATRFVAILSLVGGQMLALAASDSLSEGSIGTVAVRLRPTVVLAAPQATLAEIADLSGPADAIAALGPIVVQELRAVPVVLDEQLVRGRIGRHAPSISLVISGETRVSQPLRTISVADQVSAATAVIVNPGDDAEITLQRASGPLSLADDGTPPQIEATPLDRGRVGDVACRVRLMRGETELARGLVVLRVRRFASVITLSSSVRRGVALGAGDIAVQRVELTTTSQDALTDPIGVLGFIATRDLSPGQVLTPTLAQAPLAVRPGQGVTLVWRSGTVELTAPADALAGGHLGDIIGIRRFADQQRVKGQIIGVGRVLLNY